MPLKPFRHIPRDLAEWTRWCNDQNVGEENASTFENITVTDTATVNDLDVGFVTLTDTGWDDLTAELGSGKIAGANTPTWATFRGGIQAYSFAAAATNELWITFHIRHDYKQNTNIYPHIHWSPNTTSTGVVRWGIEYSFAKGHDQEAFPAPTTIYLEHTISVDKQYQHIITEVTDAQAFGAGTVETDGLLLCRVFREGGHANDTFPDVVFGFTADIHFEVGQITTPNKAAPFF